MKRYQDFINEKVAAAPMTGFKIDRSEVNAMLKPHQIDCVCWSILGGCRGIFILFGLGKTFIQLEIMRIIKKFRGGKVLIVCPLGIRQEFTEAGKRLGITTEYITSDAAADASTADAEFDDATLRRCIGFAKALGYDGLYMVNLFAFRSKSPRTMQTAADPVGNLNDGWISATAVRSSAIIACWGTNGGFMGRDRKMLELLKPYKLSCLGVNSDGSPKHPLYLPQDAELLEYPSVKDNEL
ncbi:MAG: DUF1643 domain-containing protein [Lentisphaerota bacterium]